MTLPSGSPSSPDRNRALALSRQTQDRQLLSGVDGPNPRGLVFTAGHRDGLAEIDVGILHGAEVHPRVEGDLLPNPTMHPGGQPLVQLAEHLLRRGLGKRPIRGHDA